jgi:diguanylate cyclase (GGDEF)-like protein
MTSDALQSLVDQAWQQAYLDPRQSLALGHRIVELSAGDAAETATAFGWLHVALAEVRVGDEALARDALARSRALMLAVGDARGTALCDEIEAILLRRAGDYAAAHRLQAEIDARPGIAWTDHDRFLAHNSRAITHNLLGQAEDALRHFYSALDAARRTGWSGAVITALGNLGSHHQDLFNLEDARALSEQALQAGRAVGARQTVGTVASNLIVIYHAAGQPERCREMADFLRGHPQELLPAALERLALPLALAALATGEIERAQGYLERGAVTVIGDGDGLVLWSWLQARCWLERGDAAGARALAERTLESRRVSGVHDQPYDLMELLRAAADACERLGDLGAALDFTRRAHAIYEQLVGRSARARFIALQVSHDVAATQRERDLALESHRLVDDDRRRLAELNQALEAKIAETERLHQQLREQALRDPLTGLNNRRHLFEVAPGLLELARRQRAQLCVVLLDMDHFKAVNDTYGHQAGDAVLKRFAQLLLQTLRRSDVVCRHGGEEFVVVMPEIGVDGAAQTLRRLLDAYRSLSHPVGRQLLPPCSFSAGLAVFPEDGGTLDQLLTRADRALYAAKSAGRARIEFAQTTAFGTL